MQTINFLLLFTLVTFGFAGHAQVSLRYCVGGSSCYSGSAEYDGPFEDYSVNGGSGAALEQRAYEAYRMGEIKKLREYEAEVQQSIIDFRVHQEQGTVTAERLEEIKAETRALLETTYPTPPQSVLDHESRRLVNPVPLNTDEQTLQKNLDPLWEQIQSSDPAGAAEELSKLNERIHPIPGAGTPELSAGEAAFIESELRLSGVVNEQGFLRLPHSRTPSDPLYTSPRTFEGADIRRGMNQLLAAESLIGAVCATKPQNGCAPAQKAIRDQIGAFYAIDRLAAMQALGNPEVYEVFTATKGLAEFITGVSNGIAKGVIGTVEGLAQLVAHPYASAKAIGNAFYNYDQTYALIEQALVKRYDMLANGSIAEKGEVVGEALFEVAALFTGPAELLKVGRGASLLSTGLFDATARIVERSAKLGTVLTKAEVRAQLVAKHLGLSGAEAEDMIRWGTKNLDTGDQGELAITFARRMEENPARLGVLREAQDAVPGLSQEAQTHMTRQLTFESDIHRRKEFSSGELQEIGKAYDRLDATMAGIAGKKAPEGGYLATRSIPKTAKHHITNQPIELTQEDVFKSGRFGEAQNDRFSQPGSQAVYTSIGDDALQTVSAETGRAPELSVIGQDYFEPQKILDLTDETVVERIGISPADILKAKTDGVTPYAVPQIIGELAKKHGFDAILTPSAAKPGGINLILFP